MSVTIEQLNSFHRFAIQQLQQHDSAFTWQEMFHIWQLENPTEVEKNDIHEALDESLDDIRNGRTEPADKVIEELRNNLVSNGA